MKNKRQCFICILFLCLILPVKVVSQDINITGLVVNTNDQPVANVRVCLARAPQIFIYTDLDGQFNLAGMTTLASKLNVGSREISSVAGGGLKFTAINEAFILTLYDLTGRIILSPLTANNLYGDYIVFPDAYIQDLSEGVYIASIKVGSMVKSVKINNLHRHINPRGLILTGYPINVEQQPDVNKTGEHVLALSKGLGGDSDILVFEHDFYKTTLLEISDFDQNVGKIVLDNFGDYSPAIGLTPDKITYNKEHGSFIEVTGQDLSNFKLLIEPFSVSEAVLDVRAIPVSKFPFLDSSFELIYGVHFEPSGKQLYFPQYVFLELKDFNSTDSLVVISRNNETGKVSYLHYLINNSVPNQVSIGFSITQLNDIVIAKGVIPDNLSKTFTTSDDAMSYIALQLALGSEVSIDVFEKWYAEVIKSKIMAIVDMETLKLAVRELMLLQQYSQYTNILFLENESFSFRLLLE